MLYNVTRKRLQHQVKISMNLANTSLLWRWDLFHVNPGYWIPASVRVSFTIASTIAYRESHFHFPVGDTLAHPFNLTYTMQIFYSIWWGTSSHVDYAVNGKGCAALGSIKGKVPPLAATVTVIDTKGAIEENAQTSFIWSLLENTLLRRFLSKKKERSGKALQTPHSCQPVVIH